MFFDISIGKRTIRSHFPLFAMHAGSYVFRQLTSVLPRHIFQQCVDAYQGDRAVRTFPCWQQFLCLCFGQLTFRESVRSIVLCLNAHPKKLYHLGFTTPVVRTTLLLANEPDVRTVVFSARWHAFMPATMSARDVAHGVLVRPDGGALTEQDVRMVWDEFADKLRDLVSSGKRVYLIAPSPGSAGFDPRKMVRRLSVSPPFVEHSDVRRLDSLRASGATTDRLRHVAESAGAVLIDPFEYLCEAEVCRTMDGNGRPVYRDSDHLRPFWAIERAHYIDQTLTHRAPK